MFLKGFAVIVTVATAFGQAPSAVVSQAQLQALMDRLDRVERQNRELADEVRGLRAELSSLQGSPGPADAPPPSAAAEDRVDVHESRIDELAQTKVGTSQHVPVSLTGMLLFNAFLNGRNGGNLEDPLTAQPNPGPSNTGATFRQTTLGLRFDGPALVGGGKAGGSVYMDFFGGVYDPSGQLFRFRLATIDLTWKNTTITAGQDKPIVSPREPTSFAQVGVSPLTAAGNLWNWRPQVRIEQRVPFTQETGIRAQGGVYLTYENDISLPATIASSLEKYRPAGQYRLEVYHDREDMRFELAAGFDASDSRAAGASIPTRIATLDWIAQPDRFVSLTGAWFRGTNTANLGSLRQGFAISSAGVANPVHSDGGWAQVAIHPLPRWTIDIYGGQQHDRSSDLGNGFFANGGITRNFTYAGNLLYHLAPNIIAAFEASRTRTSYLVGGNRVNNHYDLALGYLF